MTSEIMRGITETHYAELPGVRASTLKAFARSGLHGAASLLKPHETGTAAMRLGTALHASILEPEKFAQRWVEVKGLKPGAVSKTWAKADADLEADDVYPLAEGWPEQIRRMAKAVRGHPLAGRLAETMADRELTVTWDDPALGVKGKARIDFTSETKRGLVLGDIKTTRAESVSDFERDAARFGYHLQAAWYSRAAMMAGLCDHEPGFVFVAVTNYEPTDVVVFEACDDFLRQGRVDCERSLARLRAWNEQSEAHGMASGLVQLDLPKWMKDEAEPVHDWSEA